MKPKKIFSVAIIVFVVLLIQRINAKHVQKRGVMDNFNDGLKFASQMFGINTAADVANLVAKAFSKRTNQDKPDLFSLIQKGLQGPAAPANAETSSDNSQRTENQNRYESEENRRDPNHGQSSQANSEESQSSSNQYKEFQTKSTSAPDKENAGFNLSTANLVTSMLRLVGFDATKLGALAINALIMVASAIGNTILGATKPQPTSQRFYPTPDPENAETGPEEEYSPTEHQPRKLREGTPIDWFLQNPSMKMKRLLDDAIDSSLSDKITTMIEKYETTEGQGACLKMLMCKSSPFIWGMQKSLKKRIGGEPSQEEPDAKSGAAKEKMENNRLLDPESFFTHLPSIDEFREHGAKCEKLYSNYCNTTDLYRRKRRH